MLQKIFVDFPGIRGRFPLIPGWGTLDKRHGGNNSNSASPPYPPVNLPLNLLRDPLRARKNLMAKFTTSTQQQQQQQP